VRYDDIQVGKAYVLTRSERVKVTVLAREPNTKLLVRFENGIKAGETRLLASRALARLWGTEPTRRPYAPSNAVRRALEQIAEEEAAEADLGLAVGDIVRIAGAKTPLEWSVVAIDGEERVTIRTTIFEQEHTRVVAVSALERRLTPRAPLTLDWNYVAADEPDLLSDEERKERLRPVIPRRELDEIMDNVLFTGGCLVSYGRGYARGVSGPALNDRLRDEIKRRGFLLREKAGEYGRIRVMHRFDIVLAERPTDERPASVERLVFPAARRQRRRVKRRSSVQRRRAA
jgi:hypothetical protein